MTEELVKRLRREADYKLPNKIEAAACIATEAADAIEALQAQVEALREFAKHTNWELSCDCWDTGDWQVFEVTGGRSDREWHQIGMGGTPDEAIRAALKHKRNGNG
jgi:hypothetical protein